MNDISAKEYRDKLKGRGLENRAIKANGTDISSLLNKTGKTEALPFIKTYMDDIKTHAARMHEACIADYGLAACLG